MNEFNVYINGSRYQVQASDKTQARQKAKGAHMVKTGRIPHVGSTIRVEVA